MLAHQTHSYGEYKRYLTQIEESAAIVAGELQREKLYRDENTGQVSLKQNFKYFK